MDVVKRKYGRENPLTLLKYISMKYYNISQLVTTNINSYSECVYVLHKKLQYFPSKLQIASAFLLHWFRLEKTVW